MRTAGYDHPDAKFELLEGDVEFAEGIHLFHTPGHTVGHYSLLVELEGSRPLLFMADVSYTPAAFAADQQAGFHNNPVDGVRSIRRSQAARARSGARRSIFNHDMRDLPGLRAGAAEPLSPREVCA